MHLKAFSGPLRVLPTRPIEWLEEGRLERVHTRADGTERAVIWTGSTVALFTRGAMGRCSHRQCDLLPLLKSGLASSSLQPAQLRRCFSPKHYSTDIFTGLQ